MATEGWQKWMHPAQITSSYESKEGKFLPIEDSKQVYPPQDREKTKAANESSENSNTEFPSLEKLFRSDFPNLLRSHSGRILGIKNEKGEKKVTIGEQLYLDFPGKSKFLGYYVPMLPDSYDICSFMANEYLTTIKDFESKVSISGGHVAEFSSTPQKELVFTNRIYIYHEFSFSHQQLADLEKIYHSKGLSVVFRGPAYLSTMWKPDKISH